MKSTGEVMGVGRSFGEAFGKAQRAAGGGLPDSGAVFISVRDVDKADGVEIARELLDLGFEIVATQGTAQALRDAHITCQSVYKVKDGKRPHIVDKIKNSELSLIINTTEGRQAIADSATIRREAVQHKICYTTTLSGAYALLKRYVVKLTPSIILKIYTLKLVQWG